MAKERDIAIDIVKFLAVLFIINSHADLMYPRMKMLATGGAIGDCLFLFCSGFTLLMGVNIGGGNFCNYYKRRINRIYPSVFSAVVFVHLLRGDSQILFQQLLGGEFIIAIMAYYVLLYFISKYVREHVPLMMVLTAVVSVLVYIFWFPYKYEVSSKGLYGITTAYRWIPYFGAMLLGAYVGTKRKELHYHTEWDFMKLMFCLAVFYGFQYAAKTYRPVAPYQVITLLPLMGIVFYFYKCCHAEWLTKLYQTKRGNRMIMFVGGLCLESYLIQYSLFTDKMNGIWPLNLLLIVLLILFCSYLVRCAARLFAQTFRTEDYEWGKVFNLL